MRTLSLRGCIAFGLGLGLVLASCGDDNASSDQAVGSGTGAVGAEPTGGTAMMGSGGSGPSSGGAVATGGAGIVTTSGGTMAAGGAQSAGGGTTTGGAVATGGSAQAGATDDSGGAGGSQAAGGTGANQGSGGVAGNQTTGGEAGNQVVPGAGGNQTTSGGTSGASAAAGGTGGGAGEAAGAAGTESNGGTTNTVDCNDTSSQTGTFTGARGDTSGPIMVDGREKSYILLTNWWFEFNSQTVDYDGLSFTVNDPNDTAVPQDEGNPTGYPSLFIGTYAGEASLGSNLPIAVTEITSIPTILHTDSFSHDTSDFNAAYDVWFTESGEPLARTEYSPSRGGAYLMVWLFDPENRQPRGGNSSMQDGSTPNYAGTEVAGVPGTWDVWIDDTDPLCISYVRTTPLGGLEFDLNHFIQDSVTSGYGITESMYLSIIFAGFEIWGGGDGVTVEQFCADVR